MSDKGGGWIVPEAFVNSATAANVTMNIYQRMMPPRRPLTRIERLRARYYGARWRIEGAIDFLMGRHDCGDDR